MLQINLGDIATRIVRALGIRGRVPVALDENVVPTVLLQDQTDSLYAQNPATIIWHFQMAGQVANFSIAQLWNPAADNIVKLDQMLLIDVSTTVPVNPLLWFAGRNIANPVGSSIGPTQQGILNQDTNATPTLLPGRSLAQTNNPAANPFATWSSLGRIFLGQNSAAPVVIPLGLVLYAGDSFGVSMGPEAASVARDVIVYGREFSRG